MKCHYQSLGVFNCVTIKSCLLVGLFTIAKLARLNTLAPHQINVQDLVFKLRRKKFTIEVNKICTK